ncbi:MAG: alpha-1,4-glucan--maltose-1-phosphate maltosyltransferase, partial [Nitrospirota bacterium]|nr:alpha-1,4-glucan--maltose-1-phosphate maltosyltransferase [Nitrospirota bacterium]
ASFQAGELGRYRYTVTGWVDHFQTWRRDLIKKIEAGQTVGMELLQGARLIEEASLRASKAEGKLLKEWAAQLQSSKVPEEVRIEQALDKDLAAKMAKYPDRRFATIYEKELVVVVDREKARFSAWYEMFPRSCSDKGSHGAFGDCEARLPYIASMGFDVLYLPPIHPVGVTHRKGKNNAPTALPSDPGSPWGIGSADGGHKAIHPQLGTMKEFRQLSDKARSHGLEIALDLAFQCSPDHPYVKEHREWFKIRPDGTVQYAENPPKKYQDIYPLEFENDQWQALWQELKSVVLYWIEQDVRIFRVDNPHTKPFAFWEWLISEIQEKYPDVIFLAEAFTRPKLMYRLAKLGFSQSYTYFAWRSTKAEIVEYFTELTRSEVREYFRPHLWPNTPDILTEELQKGGRPAFMARFVLAATLGAGYGIYGPAFELCESRPREQGSEEYLDSEKYEIKQWEIGRADSLKEFIGLVNRIRRENPALHGNESLHFHPTDNEQLLCYSKSTADESNVVLVVVNLSPHHTHSGWVQLDLDPLGLDPQHPYQVQDLLTNAYYRWEGPRNYIEINPHSTPAHIFRVHRRLRTEHDFDYYVEEAGR